MSSYLDKTGLERVWDKANGKFATIASVVQLGADIVSLTNNKADKTAVEEAVANLIDSAPGTLNTLNELAAALGDDPNFATTIATEIGKKVNVSDYDDTIAGINTSIASITPANIGAAPTSHASSATTYGAASASNYGHAMASSTTPKANGTAAVGSETAKFARGDHVHPLQTSVSGSSGSCTGNAATATALTTSAGSSSKPVYFSSGKPVAISNVTLGSNTDNTYSAFGLKRKSDSDNSYANFYTWVAKTGQVGGLEFIHYNASGENDGNTSLYISTTAVYPSTNNDKNLGSSSYKWKTVYATTFNGSGASLTSLNAGNISSGTLAIARGGTGLTASPSMLVNLGSTSAANVLQASPRPGITGTLGIGNGGTGATSKSGARTNLGITSGTTLPSSASAGDIFFLYS